MVLNSDLEAYKIARQALESGEELVWAARPQYRLVLFSEVPMLLLGTVALGLTLTISNYLHLDAAMDLKYAYDLTARHNASLCCAVLTGLTFFGWLFSAWAIAKAEGIYALTTRRMMVVNLSRRKRQGTIRELNNITSVSIISDRDGNGCLCLSISGDKSVNLPHLNHVQMLAQTVADALSIPFDQICSNPTFVQEAGITTTMILEYIYQPVQVKNRSLRAIVSTGWWLFHMLIIWFWLSSIELWQQSWFWIGTFLCLSLASTAGLLRQLTKS